MAASQSKKNNKGVFYCSKFNFTAFLRYAYFRTGILSGVPGIITGFFSGERIGKDSGPDDNGIKSELSHYPKA